MEPDRKNPRTRRRFIAVLAAASAAFAGCSGTPDRGADDNSNSREPNGTDDETQASDENGASESSDESADDGEDADPDESPDCPDEPVHTEYENTPVRIVRDGEELGSVTAAIADTSETRRIGLSETDCLPEDRGMLFVYGASSNRTFWMIDMDFGIDILYLDPDGRISSIHHAPEPDEDESGTEAHHQYAGEGQYVLELPYRWTSRRGVETGDRAVFDR